MNPGKVVSWLNEDGAGPDARVTRLACHPSKDVVLAAKVDHGIQFFDWRASNAPVETMQAHMDTVTAVAVEPSGNYFASAGHDASIRFWDFGSRRCVQEMPVHRLKFNEAVHDVAYHPELASQRYVASAGADSVVKVFT